MSSICQTSGAMSDSVKGHLARLAGDLEVGLDGRRGRGLGGGLGGDLLGVPVLGHREDVGVDDGFGRGEGALVERQQLGREIAEDQRVRLARPNWADGPDSSFVW